MWLLSGTGGLVGLVRQVGLVGRVAFRPAGEFYDKSLKEGAIGTMAPWWLGSGCGGLVGLVRQVGLVRRVAFRPAGEFYDKSF